ncbi:GNAT family N-acetyltransferase [Ruminococcaceae bacterium OttesenSCG-928-A16]|nr:GNAT family N-acetyltransferase [Ruminococcaceae bacterium OttesenSCG-928-A16]
MILETLRLVLRKLTQSDFTNLCRTLQDPIAMAAYEHAFTDAEVQDWLNKQLTRYAQDGFGLWAVVLKSTDAFIGQCGLTLQAVGGQQVLEVGYLLERRYWHHGYATEAALACQAYAFNTLGAAEVYSIIRDTNLPSQAVALRGGMQQCGSLVKHYYGVDMPHYIYKIEQSSL